MFAVITVPPLLAVKLPVLDNTKVLKSMLALLNTLTAALANVTLLLNCKVFVVVPFPTFTGIAKPVDILIVPDE